jgi:ABC-type glycerol-3-phosphate transport system permease component
MRGFTIAAFGTHLLAVSLFYKAVAFFPHAANLASKVTWRCFRKAVLDTLLQTAFCASFLASVLDTRPEMLLCAAAPAARMRFSIERVIHVQVVISPMMPEQHADQLHRNPPAVLIMPV